MPPMFFRSPGMAVALEPSDTRIVSREEGITMTDECDHWLVQRRVSDRYWACVDCELEFRPVQTGPPTTEEIVRRALGRLGLGES
jgi:hypothetical protein